MMKVYKISSEVVKQGCHTTGPEKITLQAKNSKYLPETGKSVGYYRRAVPASNRPAII